MALNLQKLIDSLEELQINMPQTEEESAKKWAEIIKGYSSGAMALDTVPVFSVPLEQLFLTSMKSKTFLLMLGTNLQTFWQPVTFASATFTGVVAAAMGINLDSKMNIAIAEIMAQTEKKPLTRIATEIHNWTLSIIVTLANIQTGVTLPSTLL